MILLAAVSHHFLVVKSWLEHIILTATFVSLEDSLIRKKRRERRIMALIVILWWQDDAYETTDGPNDLLNWCGWIAGKRKRRIKGMRSRRENIWDNQAKYFKCTYVHTTYLSFERHYSSFKKTSKKFAQTIVLIIIPYSTLLRWNKDFKLIK